MESKFVASEMVGNKAEWLGNFLANISLWVRPIPSMSMHSDI